MQRVKIGAVEVSRVIVGGNPFSGFSHQSVEMDRRMERYFTAARIKQTLFEAEKLGITAVLARTDGHMRRLMLEYHDEGGALQWLAQTAPELGAPDVSVDLAQRYGAKGCYIHGGVMDYWLAQKRLDEVQPVVDKIREAGMVAGVAGHNPEVFRWADRRLDADFYMCSYYNPSRRDEHPDHVHGARERFSEEDRRAMTSLIQELSRPVIHYKVLAAGRNDPEEAFAFAARAMRTTDAVCIGVYTEEKPDMLAEDVELLTRLLSGDR